MTDLLSPLMEARERQWSELEIVVLDGTPAILVPISEDSSGCIASLECLLTPIELYGGPCHEFSFQISVDWLDGSGEPFGTQDRNIAARYIPSGLRPWIMCAVSACCARLLEHIGPNIVYRVTKGRGLPDKALQKHHLLTRTMEGCGYKIQETGTDLHGRTFWVLKSVGN